MSYQVYDEFGFKGDFATNKGGYDYLSFLRGLQLADLEKFIEQGFDLVPEAILEVLQEVNPPAGLIEETHNNFMKLLSLCEGMVIVSDGLNDDLDDEVKE